MRLHAIKALEGVKLWLHSVLISALDGEWSGLRSDLLVPEVSPPEPVE